MTGAEYYALDRATTGLEELARTVETLNDFAEETVPILDALVDRENRLEEEVGALRSESDEA